MSELTGGVFAASPLLPKSREAQESAWLSGIRGEADAGTRTPDPLLTMEVLYQLSYVGVASDRSRFRVRRGSI